MPADDAQRLADLVEQFVGSTGRQLDLHLAPGDLQPVGEAHPDHLVVIDDGHLPAVAVDHRSRRPQGAQLGHRHGHRPSGMGAHEREQLVGHRAGIAVGVQLLARRSAPAGSLRCQPSSSSPVRWRSVAPERSSRNCSVS